ncbi:acyl carrier protein [Ensifer sp. NPDC090286]|uniref:acyl carrier protein n=1 Tax=Ensifer sp. NPDC090286 TaxID=3363991 RepID=UPI00383B96B6
MQAARSDISRRVKEIVAELLEIRREAVRDDTSFVDDLQADSLEISELATAIEEEFDVYITDASLDRIVTVRDMIDFIIYFKK